MQTRAFEYALASLSGILLALSFPRFGHPAVAWIALTPLLLTLASVPPRFDRAAHPIARAFGLGLATGAVFFIGTLYWITRVMAVYGGLSTWVAVLINAALIAYLSLFPALFAIVVRRLVLARGAIALTVSPLVWVATELGRTYLLTGFPWVLLGYSQVRVLPIAQLASLFGVYGVSMLVAAVSASLALIALRVTSPARDRVPAGALSFPAAVFALVAVVAVWGNRRASAAELTRAGDPIRVGLIQGNVDQGEKWDPARAAAIFQDYLRLTRVAIDRGAELVVWPESSTPFYFEEDRPGAETVRSLARTAAVSILFGSDQIEWRAEGAQRVPDKYYNSAFLVRPDGTTAGSYRKMHLVPFGEYVPLKELLFFAGPLVEAVGPFSAGTEPSLLPVNGHPVSVAICYEVVYPNLIRQFVAGGSELLSTITNDAWFGRTSAPYQHFEQASMRAIEEGRYLVRSANTGISGIVDPYGRVLERTDIFQQTVLVGTARMLKVSTFYARHGDVLAYASAAMTALVLIASRRRVYG
jgi:apolipoprotein N-acyltransferase